MTRAPSPERFDPVGAEGKLIDIEHRGRYWWATAAVEGKDVLDAGCGTGYGIGILSAAGAAAVTGIDLDPEAVEEATRRVGDAGSTVIQGDIRELPCDDASFDIVVCFETIEHTDRGNAALGEFHRVLRPGGLLLVSSPNPAVYPPGNEHHIHEYRPDELASAVGKHFATVATFRQHPWLASVVEATGAAESAPSPNGAGPRVHACTSLDEGAETYGIVAASDAPALPSMPRVIALGRTFEVKWWSEQVEAAQREAKEARDAADESVRTQVDAARRDAHARLAEAQNDARHAIAQAKAAEASALDRAGEMGRALLEANQALAQIPLLEHRTAGLLEENARLATRVAVVEGSRSWRMTGPLRRLRGWFR